MLVDRTSRLLAAWRHRAALCLVPAALSLGGCAQSPARTMARAWEDLPKIRWKQAQDADAESDEKPAEVKIAGKLRKSDDSEPLNKADKSTIGRFRLSAKSTDAKPAGSSDEWSLFASRKSGVPRDPFLEDELAAREKDRSPTDEPEPLSQMVSQRDRLKAALSDDSRRGSRRDEPQTAQHDQLRLRVDSLMARARHHLEHEELAAAQRAAELAQHLAEDGELEFAPDEERPIDLLTTILARREAEAAAETVAASDADGLDADAADLPAVKPAVSRQRTSDAAFGWEADAAFDPYAEREAQALNAPGRKGVFGTSIVVLELPSFDDDEATEVNPTGYVPPQDRPASRRLLALTRQTQSHQDVLEDLPDPATTVGPSFEEAVAPPPPDATHAAVVPPAQTEPREGPKLGSISLSEIQSVQEEADPESEEIRPAGVWPRWLPLSLLSILIAAFSAWLWRRRLASAE